MMQCVATPEHLAANAAGAALNPALDSLLTRESGPVTLMLHGFKYCPFHTPSAQDPDLRDPHRLIYSDSPETTCDRVASWPALLNRPGPTLGIAWPAMHDGRGSLAAMRGFGQVYERARQIARQVARLADRIAILDPTRRIDLIGHSLGGRIALAALPLMQHAEPSRVLLWGAAERANVAATQIANASARTVIVNVRAHSNARFDSMFEWVAPGVGPALGAVGQIDGISSLTLDDPVTEKALASRGLPLDTAPRGKCHWSFYTRAGTGPLYAALLDQPGIWTANRIAGLSRIEGVTPPSLVATLSALLPANLMRGA